MNRRNFVLISLVSGWGLLPDAHAAPARVTHVRNLDLEVNAVGSSARLHLPSLLQRRCMLLAIESDSRAAAAWLERELQRLTPELLDELYVVLVDSKAADPTHALMFESEHYPGLQLYRTTAEQWRRAAVGPVLPQLFGFASSGRLLTRAVGAVFIQAGLAHFHTALRKASGVQP